MGSSVDYIVLFFLIIRFSPLNMSLVVGFLEMVHWLKKFSSSLTEFSLMGVGCQVVFDFPLWLLGT
jgi:hypothetical protein